MDRDLGAGNACGVANADRERVYAVLLERGLGCGDWVAIVVLAVSKNEDDLRGFVRGFDKQIGGGVYGFGQCGAPARRTADLYGGKLRPKRKQIGTERSFERGGSGKRDQPEPIRVSENGSLGQLLANVPFGPSQSIGRHILCPHRPRHVQGHDNIDSKDPMFFQKDAPTWAYDGSGYHQNRTNKQPHPGRLPRRGKPLYKQRCE